MILRWTRRAIGDLGAIRTDIGADNPLAAEQVALRILSSVERLTAFPGSGRAGRKPDTRELVIPGTPYSVVYRVRTGTDAVEILRVLHAARQRLS